MTPTDGRSSETTTGGSADATATTGRGSAASGSGSGCDRLGRQRFGLWLGLDRERERDRLGRQRFGLWLRTGISWKAGAAAA